MVFRCLRYGDCVFKISLTFIVWAMKNVEQHVSNSHIVTDFGDKSHELLKSIGNNRANTPDNFLTRLFAKYS